jgi:hypothetical protein
VIAPDFFKLITMKKTIEIPANEHEFPELGDAIYMYIKSRFRNELWLNFSLHQIMTKIAGGERAEKIFTQMEMEQKYIPFRVKKLAAKSCGVTIDDMDSPVKKTEIAFSRFLYWWYLTFKMGYSFTSVGLKNNREHATIVYGAKIVEGRTDKQLKPQQREYRAKFFELLKKENL